MSARIRSIKLRADSRDSSALFVIRNKTCVVIETHIPLSAETVEDQEQFGMLGVNFAPNEFDDGDVMAWLAPCAEAMTEHKSQ